MCLTGDWQGMFPIHTRTRTISPEGTPSPASASAENVSDFAKTEALPPISKAGPRSICTATATAQRVLFTGYDRCRCGVLQAAFEDFGGVSGSGRHTEDFFDRRGDEERQKPAAAFGARRRECDINHLVAC